MKIFKIVQVPILLVTLASTIGCNLIESDDTPAADASADAAGASGAGGSAGPDPLNCPTDYIEVPGNATVGAPDNFCVMKYEASDSGGVPASAAAGRAWVGISQVTAWSECDSLNSEGGRAAIDSDTGEDGTYALISNPEWMAIARNIETNTENEALNWTGFSVGTGELVTGHVGRNGKSANTARAFSSQAHNLFNWGGGVLGATDASGDIDGRRTLYLSNDEIIWDFSGNVAEWVDWTLGSPLSTSMTSGAGGNKPYDLTVGSPTDGWFDLDLIDRFSALAPAESLLPTNASYNATQAVGRYYPGVNGGASGGAAVRGGDYDSNNSAGIFALDLYYRSTDTDANKIGFRCVFRVAD